MLAPVPAPISSVRPDAFATSSLRRLPMLRSSPRRIMRSYIAANTKSHRCSPWTVPAAAADPLTTPERTWLCICVDRRTLGPCGRPLPCRAGPAARVLRSRYGGGDDLCVLDRVDELPEARQLAVADLPDVDCRHVQGLAGCLAGARVADDCRDGCAGSDEFLGCDREALNVLCDRAKDLLRHGLGAAVQASVWHALGLEPFNVLSECSEHGGHIASAESGIDTLDQLDVLLTHGSPSVGGRGAVTVLEPRVSRRGLQAGARPTHYGISRISMR